MAIIYPEHCKNITGGVLRQVKQHGQTTSGGGVFDAKVIREDLAKSTYLYFNKTEPAGVYMSSIEESKKQLQEGTEALQSSATKLVAAAHDANKKMSDVTGKFRDGTEKLATAIDKLMKVAGRGDFEKTVQLTESLVNSLERLAALEEKGLLDRVMKAMQK